MFARARIYLLSDDNLWQPLGFLQYITADSQIGNLRFSSQSGTRTSSIFPVVYFHVNRIVQFLLHIYAGNI